MVWNCKNKLTSCRFVRCLGWGQSCSIKRSYIDAIIFSTYESVYISWVSDSNSNWFSVSRSSVDLSIKLEYLTRSLIDMGNGANSNISSEDSSRSNTNNFKYISTWLRSIWEDRCSNTCVLGRTRELKTNHVDIIASSYELVWRGCLNFHNASDFIVGCCDDSKSWSASGCTDSNNSRNSTTFAG